MSIGLEKTMVRLPDTDKGVVVILSGGMDSTIALRLCVHKYGADKVAAISFEYGQNQVAEIGYAHATCTNLKVQHHIFDLRSLGAICQGFSANVDKSIPMPTIKEVLGNPRPPTYVANRNMVMLSIAAAYAEVNNKSYIICGLQARDEYSYHDTTPEFVQHINDALMMNRIHRTLIIAPFANLKKSDEIKLLLELDGDVKLLKNTLTCYNPDANHKSCGTCPTCAERIKAFMDCGLVDPIKYQIKIPWKKNETAK